MQILASGAFQITNFFPVVKENFEGCLETYRNDQELIEKIRYFLNHDSERNMIATKGHLKAEDIKNKYDQGQMIINDYLLFVEKQIT